jgi:uncharacterized Fe-S cluster-containing radical SAM superfamily protein
MQQFVPQDEMLSRYRAKAIDLVNRRVLVTNFQGTQQALDLTEPPNCQGYGRVRHFVRRRKPEWPDNPLPIDPARHALGLHGADSLLAQVFQFAACAWRCWYCFVPYSLLDANQHHSALLSAEELIDLWLVEETRPQIIDLTGGAPELVPEWVVWMMRELRRRQLDRHTYLWSDDSLSNDLFWSNLSKEDRLFVASYRNYGRVCCLKGFDSQSFAFNTRAHPEQFQLQLQRLRRLTELELDLFVYVTLTSHVVEDIESKMRVFVDQLQGIDEYLPLRVVPLRVEAFTPTLTRMNAARDQAIQNQVEVARAWLREMESRYSLQTRMLPIHLVPLGKRAPCD